MGSTHKLLSKLFFLSSAEVGGIPGVAAVSYTHLPVRLSLAADDLFIVPPKWFFVKPYFLEAFELSELGALQTSQCQLVLSLIHI